MKKLLRSLRASIAKRMYNWSVKILKVDQDLSQHLKSGEYKVGRFAMRYPLKDSESAFLLNLHSDLPMGLTVLAPEASVYYSSIADMNSLTVDKLQERYAEKFIDHIKPELMKMVKIVPATGRLGRVDFFVTRFTGIQELNKD